MAYAAQLRARFRSQSPVKLQPRLSPASDCHPSSHPSDPTPRILSNIRTGDLAEAMGEWGPQKAGEIGQSWHGMGRMGSEGW